MTNPITLFPSRSKYPITINRDHTSTVRIRVSENGTASVELRLLSSQRIVCKYKSETDAYVDMQALDLGRISFYNDSYKFSYKNGPSVLFTLVDPNSTVKDDDNGEVPQVSN